MLPAAISNLDWHLVERAVAFSNRSPVHTLVVYYAAEVLIFFFGVALYALWVHPQPASEKHGNKKAVIMAVMTVTVALAAKTLISFVVDRHRPFVAHPELLSLPLRVDTVSFPSGHALLAFAIATSLILSGVKKLGWTLAVLAVIVALGRVFAGVHYPTDVIGGALIGIASAFVMHREASSLKQYLPNH